MDGNCLQTLFHRTGVSSCCPVPDERCRCIVKGKWYKTVKRCKQLDASRRDAVKKCCVATVCVGLRVRASLYPSDGHE